MSGPISMLIKMIRNITPMNLARKRLSFIDANTYLLLLITCQKVEGGIEVAPL